MSQSFRFIDAPGHLIRRTQQLAVAIFMEETAGFDATPVQFAILNALIDEPGKDQITLSGRVALDPATLGAVIGRLEAKGWIRREADAADKRRKCLWITETGQTLVLQMKRAVVRSQQRIVAPLDAGEQAQLAALLQKLVAAHEAGASAVQADDGAPRLKARTARRSG